MNCWHCKSSLRWCSDFDYEDYGLEGDGIVSTLMCDECGSEVIVYYADNRTSMEKANDSQDPNYKRRRNDTSK
jgi:hypothetical protein